MVLAVIGTANDGLHGAVRFHDDHGAGIKVHRLAVFRQRRVDRFLGSLLQCCIDGGARRQNVLPFAVGQTLHFIECPIEKPVRACTIGMIDGAGGRQPRRLHLAGGVKSRLDEIIENVIRARTRRWQVDMRGIFRRRLEQASHHRAFGHRDLAHRVAEVELRCSLNAECTATHIGAIEIHFQDFALREPALQQERQKDFLDLALDRSLRRQEQVFGELLRQRRAALHNFIGLDVGHQGARRAQQIDAEVVEEAAVFSRERRVDQYVWNFVQRHAVIVQDAALAKLIAVLIEKFDRELASGKLAFVEIKKGRQGQCIEHDEPTGRQRQGF